MKKLEFPAGTFHAITAAIDFDFSGLGQGKTSLAPAERLRQRDDFALLPVYWDAQRFKAAHDFMSQFFEVIQIRQHDEVVVHIVAGSLDTSLALNPIVHRTRQRHHLLLTGFHTQRHSTSWNVPGCALDNGICKPPQVIIQDNLPMPLVDEIVRSKRKVLLQVN